MKRTICVTLILVMIVGMTGCQKPEKSPVYESRGDKHLTEKILTENADTKWLSELYKEDMHIQQTFEYDKKPIELFIDAKVQVPGDRMPAAIVKPHRFTQEEADAIIAYLVGDAHFVMLDLYDKDGNIKYKNIPKSTIAGIIESLENEIAHYQSSFFDSLFESSKESAVESLATYKEMYPVAKEINKFPEASRKFGKREVVRGFYASEFEFLHSTHMTLPVYPEYEETHVLDEIDGYFEKNGVLFRLRIDSDDTGKWSKMELSRPFPRFWRPSTLKSVSQDEAVIVYEDAVRTAEDVVKSIGAYSQGMRLANGKDRVTLIDGEAIIQERYYRFDFAKEINGVLCDYNKYYNVVEQSENLWRSGWGYENFEVRIDDYGFVGIIWENPCEIIEVLTNDAPMLPFEQIMKCFIHAMFIKYDVFIKKDGNSIFIRRNEYTVIDSEYDAAEIAGDYLGQWYISEIVLDLVRVQAGDEYLLIPVWNFYGSITWLSKEGEKVELWIRDTHSYLNFLISDYETPVMTLNAIDGSVVDKRYGY